MPFDEPDALLDRQDEHQEAVRRRYKEARAAGLSIVDGIIYLPHPCQEATLPAHGRQTANPKPPLS